MTDFDFTLGVCGPIESDTWPGDFEFSFLDYDQLQRMTINSEVIRNGGLESLQERLETLTPEYKAFILEAALLICEALEE